MTDEKGFAHCLAHGRCRVAPSLCWLEFTQREAQSQAPATSALAPEEWEAHSPLLSGLEGRGRLQQASERRLGGLRSAPGMASAVRFAAGHKVKVLGPPWWPRGPYPHPCKAFSGSPSGAGGKWASPPPQGKEVGDSFPIARNSKTRIAGQLKRGGWTLPRPHISCF